MAKNNLFAIINYDPDYTSTQLRTDEASANEAFERATGYKTEGTVHLIRVTEPEKFEFYSGRDNLVKGGEVVKVWDAEDMEDFDPEGEI